MPPVTVPDRILVVDDEADARKAVELISTIAAMRY